MLKSDRLVACVRIPDLPIQAEIARRPYLAGLPFVVGAAPFGGSGAAGTVGWCSQKAQDAGVRPGMPIREALAVCGETMALSPDFDYYAHIQEAMLDALEAWAPVVEEGENGSAYIDLAGMERLYPDAADLLARLAAAASSAARGLRASAAAGPNKFVAHMAAFGKGGVANNSFPVVPSPAAREFLAPFPVHSLPISDEAKGRLFLFGLKTLGQIAALSAGAMEAQFGREGRRAWELARGIDKEPVVARRPFRPIAAALAFPAPTVDWASFWIGLGRLISEVWQRKERKQRTVRQVEISARTDEDDVWERSVTFHEPIGDRDRLEAALRRRLAGAAFPGAVVSLTLRITALGGAFVGQETLFADGGQRLKRIREAVAKVKARHGTTGLYRIAEVEPWSRIPERRYALVNFEP